MVRLLLTIGDAKSVADDAKSKSATSLAQSSSFICY